MPTYGEWQPGLVHQYERVYGSANSGAPAARGYLTPAPHGHDPHDAPLRGATSKVDLYATGTHIANDVGVVRSVLSQAWEQQADINIGTAYPSAQYVGTDIFADCVVAWDLRATAWIVSLPDSRLDEQHYAVAPEPGDWPAGATGVEFHPDDTRIEYLDAEIPAWGSATLEGSGAPSLHVKEAGVAGPTLENLGGLEAISTLPSAALDSLPLGRSMNNLYGPDPAAPIQQLHVFFLPVAPDAVGHVTMTSSWSPWWALLVTYRTARFRYVFADQPEAARTVAPLRVVQRGSDGLGVSGGRRIIAGRSQQASNRRGAAFL